MRSNRTHQAQSGATFPNSAVTVTSGYDALLRRSSLDSGTGILPVTFTYDAASRLSSVAQASLLASYSYLRNSSLVSNITFKTGGVTKMTTTKAYDNLFRMTSIRTQDSGLTTLSVAGSPGRRGQLRKL
jgi:hypothetical protein